MPQHISCTAMRTQMCRNISAVLPRVPRCAARCQLCCHEDPDMPRDANCAAMRTQMCREMPTVLPCGPRCAATYQLCCHEDPDVQGHIKSADPNVRQHNQVLLPWSSWYTAACWYSVLPREFCVAKSGNGVFSYRNVIVTLYAHIYSLCASLRTAFCRILVV